MRHWLLLLFLFISVTACAQGPIKEDKEMSAIEGGDFTGLILTEGVGCANKIVPGFSYCRKTEGDASLDMIYFVGPVTNCRRSACVEFKVFRNGEVVTGGEIPKKEFRKGVKWSELLKRDTFQFGDAGFWSYTYRIYWLDGQGREVVSVAMGEIRLRVLKKDYTPLHNVSGDSNFHWKFWTRERTHIKMTTGMRTFVSS